MGSKEVSAPAELFTIGVGRQKLQKILQRLVDNRINLVIDIRFYADVATPGFKQSRDLAILLKELAGIEYRREELLVPTRELLVQYGRDKNWKRFESSYLELLASRRAEEELKMEQYSTMKACLLGEDVSPERDYRRAAAEYLQRWWKIGKINHLPPG